MKRRVFFVVATLIGVASLTSCGSGSDKLALSGSAKNFTMDPKYTEFCTAYDNLSIALDSIAKSGTTKESFAEVLRKSQKLVDVAPQDIADAVLSNDAILNTMDHVYSTHGYDEKNVSADTEVKKEVETLYSQPSVIELGTKYSKYVVKNCGVSTTGR